VSASFYVIYTRMPFNSEGRYFDAADEVVYTVDGQAGWALLLLLALTVAAAAACALVWLRRGASITR